MNLCRLFACFFFLLTRLFCWLQARSDCTHFPRRPASCWVENERAEEASVNLTKGRHTHILQTQVGEKWCGKKTWMLNERRRRKRVILLYYILLEWYRKHAKKKEKSRIYEYCVCLFFKKREKNLDSLGFVTVEK